MKKIIILLMFMSSMAFAKDPNFDTTTNIVTFPRVTVDNNTAFTNVQLLLNPNGIWSILAAIPEVPTAFADEPNFDTSTNIVTLPRVTVDNYSAFTNVQLLLNSNETWSILAATAEEILNLNGNWGGTAASSIFVGCTGEISGSLIQNGNNLTGAGTLIGNCIGGGSGEVSGTINGDNISFGLAFNNNTSISFTGVISSDYRTLSGTYIWADENDQGSWSLSLQ